MPWQHVAVALAFGFLEGRGLGFGICGLGLGLDFDITVGSPILPSRPRLVGVARRAVPLQSPRIDCLRLRRSLLTRYMR